MDNQLSQSRTRNLWLLAGGSTAIILGLIFLAENLTRSDFDDLWALALLPLALAFVAQARYVYVQAGRITGTVAGWVVIGLGTGLAALALIFSLDAGELWPVFFIIVGVGAVLAAWR